MDEYEFNELLDRHGGNLARWPVEQATRAQRLLTHSVRAQDSLAAARSLDAAMAALPRPGMPADLAARILARATRRDAWERLSDWFNATLWRPLAAAAVPLVIGFAVGLQSAPLAETDTMLMAELSELPLSATFEEPIYDE